MALFDNSHHRLELPAGDVFAEVADTEPEAQKGYTAGQDGRNGSRKSGPGVSEGGREGRRSRCD